jgi:hypothetical protein
MNSEKLYRGEPPGTVIVSLPSGCVRSLHHVVLHSPSGFAWGYGGSGPADLALSILCDVFGERPRIKRLFWGDFLAHNHYQQFKWEFVATWPSDQNWEVSSVAILEWLRCRGTEVPGDI